MRKHLQLLHTTSLCCMNLSCELKPVNASALGERACNGERRNREKGGKRQLALALIKEGLAGTGGRARREGQAETVSCYMNKIHVAGVQQSTSVEKWRAAVNHGN